MHEELTVQILDKLGLFWDDLAYNKNSKISWGDLIYNLLEYRSIAEVSKHINISNRTLERILPLTLGKILNKDSSNTQVWKFILLEVIDLRQCFECKQYKSLKEYYSNAYLKKCILCDKKHSKERYSHNKEAINLRSKLHYSENKHYYILKSSARRKLLIQATPAWADLLKIKEIYNNCPKECHVDHIIPLQGKNICGLHVENNLQYLTAEENRRKSNKYYGM